MVIQDCHEEPTVDGWFKRKREEMKVSDYLDSSCIHFCMTEERDSVLKELVDVLFDNGKIEDASTFYQAVLEREELVSTGVGMQVAIPHAKSDDFKEFFIAVGIQKNTPIEWHSLDKAPVRLIFLIGGPDNEQTKYLKILSSLTQVIKDEKIRKKLLSVSSQQQFMDIFSNF